MVTRWRAILVTALSLAACGGAGVSNGSRDANQAGRGSSPAAVSTQAAAPAIMTQPALVENCAPCTFRIGTNLPDFAVTFKVRELPDAGRLVESLQVSRADRPGAPQTLDVHKMTPVPKGDDFFIGADDINFDGYRDLFFATSRGVANTYADYWLFDPAKGEFTYLGNTPVFKVDAEKHELSTYERGGDGGMIYTARRYAFENGTLVVTASEEQEKAAGGAYQKRVFERRGGKLELVKREMVRPPK